MPKFFNSLVLAASLDKWLAEGRRENINFERQYIHFRPDITKTGEGRISSLIEPARSELLALKERGVRDPSIFGISVHKDRGEAASDLMNC
jgi:hypothetical protein